MAAVGGAAAATLCSFSKDPLKPKRQNLALSRPLCALVEAGKMAEALSLFRTAAKPDTFLWNVMIRGFTDAASFDDALRFHQLMQAAASPADSFTFPFVLKSCAVFPSPAQGLKAHAQLLKIGLDSDVFTCNALVAFYSKFGLLDSAERVFDEMPMRDVVSWNSMIDGYVSNGEEHEGLVCFKEMQDGFGVKPDWFGIMSALAACSSPGISPMKGREIHCHVIRHGFEFDTKLSTSLLDMHCKCGNILYAERLFDRMPRRTAAPWNVMIGGYGLNDRPDDAFACLARMQAENVAPSDVTMVNLLVPCEQSRSIAGVNSIHGVVLRRGFTPHLVLENALIDTYGKCGEVRSAESVFERMSETSLVSWNTMIAAYVQNEKCSKALDFFVELQRGPMEPDAFTVTGVVAAYAELASLRHGKQIHDYSVKSGFTTNTYVLNALVDMYARCGDLKSSRKVFDGIPHKTVVSWNTIILAHGIHGLGKTALELFSGMKDDGSDPDASTFMSVLSSCSFSGLVDEGKEQFNSMQRDYGIAPRIEHYGCMVDLMGRSGDLESAMAFIEEMPLAPTARIWGSLLTASRNWKNIEVAEFAADRIFELEHDNTGCYVVLSSMYADEGRWGDVERMRYLMEEKGLQRILAKSLVELSSKTCSFVNGDESHVEISTVNQVSDILSFEIGESVHGPITTIDLATGKRAIVPPRRHSVRLAVCFGLISSVVGEPILVKKNVRICDHCHHAIKLISRYSRREIIVGDSRIYHRFSDGVCSCGDYW